MTMKNIRIFILGLAICGCAGPGKDQPESDKGAGNSVPSDLLIDAVKVGKNEDGLHYLKGEKKPFTGSTIKHHKNGSKKEVETYKEGKYHGVHRGWYASGKKEYESSWKQGVQNGLTVDWHENGVKSGELTKYMGGIEGGFLEWYPSGKLKKKSVYKNDISISYLAWHENGKVMEERKFKDGKITLLTRYYEDSAKEGVGSYKDGIIILWTEYYKNGARKKAEPFKDGELHGITREWHENGVLKNEVALEKGEANGLQKAYSETGNVIAIVSVSANKLDFQKSIRLTEELIAANEKKLGLIHPDLISSYHKKAELFLNSGNLQGAIGCYKKMVWICANDKSEIFPKASESMADAWDEIGILQVQLSDFKTALASHEKALAIRMDKLSPEHKMVAQSYHNISYAYYMLVEYDKAIEFFEKARSINKKNGESESAAAYNNIAQLYADMGQPRKALEFGGKALEIFIKEFGEDHEHVATAYTNVGAYYGRAGDYSKAMEMHKKALGIREKILGPKHRLIALSKSYIGSCHFSAGDYEAAEKMYNQALAIRIGALGPNNVEVAHAYRNLALVHRARNNSDKALKLEYKALAIKQKHLPPNDTSLKLSYEAICLLLMDMGKDGEAKEMQRKLHEWNNNMLVHILSFASYQQRLDYQDRYGGMHAYSILGTLGMAEEMTKSILLNKGIVLASILEDQILARKYNDPAVDGLISELREATKRYNSLVGRANNLRLESDEESRKKLITEKRNNVENLQMRLAKETGKYGIIRESLSVTIDQIKNALPENGSIIEFVQYNRRMQKGRLGVMLKETAKGLAVSSLLKGLPAQRSGILEGDLVLSVDGKKTVTMAQFSAEMKRFKPGKEMTLSVFRNNEKINFKTKPEKSLSDTLSYGAIILSNEGEPKWVPLGPAEAIRQLLSNYSPLKPTDDEAYEEVLRGLHAKLMAPVVKQLPKGTKTLLLCPDGPLNFLSFATLLTEEDTFLSEKYILKYVSSGRDLMRKFQPAQGSLAVYANPAYTEKPIRLANAEGKGINLRSVDRDELRGSLQFKALPGTQKEADYLKNKAESWKLKADVFVGKAATEGAISRVKSPRILHLATHGFFMPEAKEGRKQSPMVRSGLAFAGAQKTLDAWAKGEAPPTHNDGILTAAEVSVLDLKGTWLVTLSACETGRGEARSGEGVLGLRRAFIQAGTQNLLMTLWPVDDKQTIPFMKDFYERAMAGGDAPESLAKVQTERLVKLRDVLGARLAVQFAGPFIMSFQGAE
jgi:CHAT domain-containing protein/antitoxin component YwqK of YwqJK toxin-antitoxin module/Tfp pilus assembly protein PilF